MPKQYWVAVALTTFVTPAFAAQSGIPDFSGLWARTSLGYEKPINGQGGVKNRMLRPNGSSNLSQLVGDYSDPLLTPAAGQVLKRLGEISIKGIAFPQPSNQCLPYPPPYISSNNQEIELLQEKNRVTIPTMFDHQFRHVRLNSRHPAHVTPSWYGDSIGHYEGDVLVVDTVGIKVTPLSMVDIYGTPFSNKLHVTEKFHLVDDATARAYADRGEAENGRVAGDNGDGVELDPLTAVRGCNSKSRSRIRKCSPGRGRVPLPIDGQPRGGRKWSAPKTSMNITPAKTPPFQSLSSLIFRLV